MRTSRTCSRRLTSDIREDLIAARIEAIHAAGAKAAVAATPGAARRFGPFSADHGADLFLVQSQVSSARHLATGYDPLSLEKFTRFMPIPVAVGNTTNADAAFALMEQGRQPSSSVSDQARRARPARSSASASRR